MKKFSLFLLFCILQAFLFAWLRTFSSFDQAKLVFVSSQTMVCSLSGLLYLYIISQAQRESTSYSSATKNDPAQNLTIVSPKLQAQLEAEKKDLIEKLDIMNKENVTLKSQLQEEEERSKSYQETVKENEKKDFQASVRRTLYGQALRDLASEIQKLCSQIEQDRKTHAIEIRALLGKDEKQIGSTSIASLVPQPTIAPIASVLLLLLQCQKGFEKSEISSWPDAEHRDLIRRAFFDRLEQAPHVPFAVFSLDRPTELHLSPRFPQPLTPKICTQITQAVGDELRQLSALEPFQINIDCLAGTYVAFKVVWTNLDDLIILAPLL